jgi:hypothetical protein
MDQLQGLLFHNGSNVYDQTITDTRLPFDYQHNVCDSGKYYLNNIYMIRSIKRILKRISLSVIQRRIESGKTVYFESPLEELAFKYIPDEPGPAGKYYAKYFGQDEYEINPDSSSVYLAIREGQLIFRHRYDRYHLIKGVHWNRKIKTPMTYKSVGT